MKPLSKEAKKLRKDIVSAYFFRDAASFAVLDTACQAYDLMREAKEQIDKDGLTVQGDRGGVKAHPLLRVVAGARTSFLSAIKQLELDPNPEEPPRKPGAPTWMEKQMEEAERKRKEADYAKRK